MSKGTTAHRVALLSSSSLGLAAIASAASLGAALSPTAARAADECGVQSGSTPLVCSATSYASGVTYDANGNLVITFTPTTSNIGGNGVVLTGSGSESITFDSATTNTELQSANTAGALLDVTTVNGNIDIDTEEMDADASAAGVTHGIRAAATGTGNIDIRTIGTVDAEGANPATSIGIEAVTNVGNITINTGSTVNANRTAIFAGSSGGNIAITTTGVVGSASGNYSAPVLRNGIVAQTTGAGAVSINVGASVFGSGPAGAAINIANGTGDVLIDATNVAQIRGGNHGSSTNQSGAGIIIDSGGDITINSNGLIMGAINVTGARPAAITASGQTFTLNFTGDPTRGADDIGLYRGLGGFYGGTGGASFGTGTPFGRISFVSGQQDVASYAGGHIDLSGITAGTELNFNSRSRWVLTDTSLMSPADDVVNIDATSILVTTRSEQRSQLIPDVDQTFIPPGVIDFGSGVDTLNVMGRVIIGPSFSSPGGVGTSATTPPTSGERFGMRGEIRLLNLEQFNNSGDIWLGATFFGPLLTMTDRWHDDLLYVPGATFHGAEGSRLFLDVDLNKTQSSCSPSTRDGEGYLPAADCIGLQGGAATGRTEIRIFEQIPGDRGAYNPDGIVLVDLAGGDPDATDPGAFVISPDTPRYLDIGNGGIEKGVFAYILGFDADTQQFKLVGAPSSGGQQFPILATAANQLWRTSTGGWFDRRVHQRDVGLEGLGTGAWFNVTGMATERDISTSIAVGSDDVVFDNSYEQSDVTISFGWDFLDYDNNATLGAMFGYAHSEVEFDDSDNSANLEGIHAGVYGGYGVGGFWIDGAINGALLSLHNDVPAMNLEPAGTVLDSDVWSLGGRVEAGWRFNAMGGLWLEPLVGLSAVSTEFEDIRVPNDDPDPTRPGVTVKLDSAESRRASAGLRFGVTDVWSTTAPTSFSLTARAVNEFAGGADVSVENVGPTYLSVDTLDGTFTQVTGSVTVSTPDKAFSGYLNLDSVKGDDYDSLGASIGVRLHW